MLLRALSTIAVLAAATAQKTTVNSKVKPKQNEEGKPLLLFATPLNESQNQKTGEVPLEVKQFYARQQYSPELYSLTYLQPQYQTNTALSRLQPQIVLYGPGVQGQPILINPGNPPGNFLIPQGPGPNVIVRNGPQGPPGSVFPAAGYPKPAHIPPIEKDAEEIPTNPAKIPPLQTDVKTSDKPRGKPEKLENAKEQPNQASQGIKSNQSQLPQSNQENTFPNQGPRFFILNGDNIIAYPFEGQPDFPVFRYSDTQPFPQNPPKFVQPFAQEPPQFLQKAEGQSPQNSPKFVQPLAQEPPQFLQRAEGQSPENSPKFVHTLAQEPSPQFLQRSEGQYPQNSPKFVQPFAQEPPQFLQRAEGQSPQYSQSGEGQPQEPISIPELLLRNSFVSSQQPGPQPQANVQQQEKAENNGVLRLDQPYFRPALLPEQGLEQEKAQSNEGLRLDQHYFRTPLSSNQGVLVQNPQEYQQEYLTGQQGPLVGQAFNQPFQGGGSIQEQALRRDVVQPQIIGQFRFTPSGPSGLYQFKDDSENDAIVIDAASDYASSNNNFNRRGSISEAEEAAETSSTPSSQQSTKESKPSMAQAGPQATAIAGPGGVAGSGPRGTAIVGRGGLAVSSPQATAVAGTKEEVKKKRPTNK